MRKYRKMAVSLFLAMGLCVTSLASNPLQTKAAGHVIDQPDNNSSSEDDMFFANYLDDGMRVDSYKPLETDGLNRATYIPYRYDSRDYGRITSVKNQGQFGTCWAFSAMGQAESALISRYPSKYNKDNIDLSEYHLSYFLYNKVNDKKGNIKGDSTTFSPGGLQKYYAGGNCAFALFSLASWKGAVRESKAPYENLIQDSLPNSLAYKDDFHLQNANIVSMQSMDEIKSLIMQYGSVASSIYWDNNYIGSNDTLNQQVSYVSNHAIDVIGWDDSFSRTLFRNMPAYDGAWLIKNSYGYGYHEYLWVSYDDLCLSQADAYVFLLDSASNYDNIYQYDGSCGGKCLPLLNGSSLANVFKCNSSTPEILKACSFGVYDNNIKYKIRVYKNPKKNNPLSGKLVETKSGRLTYAGYYTIKLSKKVKLEKGDKFTICVTFENPADSMTKVFVDADYYNTYAGKGQIIFNSEMKEGQSYMMGYDDYGELNVYDIQEYDNLISMKAGYHDITPRIKAFTDTAPVNISECTINVPSMLYTGKALKPTPRIKYSGKNLVKDRDFTVSYKKNINTGTGTAIITGKGSYSGSKTVKFKINKASIAKASVAKIKDKKYNHKFQKPSVTIKYYGKKLKKKKDFTVSYKNNKRKGTATVIIKGKGNFKGTKKVKFKIK